MNKSLSELMYMVALVIILGSFISCSSANSEDIQDILKGDEWIVFEMLDASNGEKIIMNRNMIEFEEDNTVYVPRRHFPTGGYFDNQANWEFERIGGQEIVLISNSEDKIFNGSYELTLHEGDIFDSLTLVSDIIILNCVRQR